MYTSPYHMEIYEGSFSADCPSPQSSSLPSLTFSCNRYESQKQRDWNTFSRYLRNLQPPVTISTSAGEHVIEFLRELDQFGKTKVHGEACCFFGQPDSPSPCACPLRQAWGSLDALIGRLRAAFEKHEGKLSLNPFAAPEVKLYLREVREFQAKARGITYNKKKKIRPPLMAESSYQPPEEA